VQHVKALDGVRGVAVLSVITYHFTQPALQGVGGRLPAFGGGFLGVDLFFVLSGFLITGLLIREHDGAGRIALKDFWLRRARRLLPALFLLLLVVAGMTATYSPMEKGTMRWDILTGIAYVINWRFVASGQSYFDNLFAPSPVKHLWSLAIEEQYYLLWPLLVALVLGFVLRRGGIRDRRKIFALLTIAILASAVVLAMTYVQADPSRAYYGTDGRAHELLVGAAAAAVAGRWSRTGGPPPRVYAISALAGLCGITLSMLVMSDRGALYYHGGSLFFSLCAALLIVGVLDRRSPIARLMEYRVLAYTGTISYGLYLWHWPIAVWLTADRSGLAGSRLLIARLGVTLAVALVSFYLLEQPARSGSLRVFTETPVAALKSVGCVLVTLLIVTAVTTYGAEDRPDYLVNQAAPPQPASVPRTAAAQAVGAPGPIALIGDSVARNFAPVFQQYATGTLHRTSYAFGFGGCATGDLQYIGTSLEGLPADYCKRQLFDVWTKQLDTLRPEYVFIHSRRDGYDLFVDGKHLVAGTPEWLAASEAEWDRTLRYLIDHGTRTVVLILPLFSTGQTPQCESGDPAEAHTQRCGATPDGFMGEGPLRAALRHWAARHTDTVKTVDLVPFVCPQSTKPCPKKVDGITLRIADGIHFTDKGQAWIVPKLFARSGLFGGPQ
jgi:peptidoglycan/LPS O-acetylase OafA/YrhL